MTATSLSTKIKISYGGRLSKRLSELEAAGFIKRFIPLGKKKRDAYYRITDEYSMFYLHWIEPLAERGETPGDDHYWHTQINTPQWNSWAGFAFERICFKHANNIKKALGLTLTPTKYSDWKYTYKVGKKEQGAQIDLLFDRDDDVITLFEIKYSQKQYVMDKKTASNIANKVMIFEKYYPTTKQISVGLITTIGMKSSIWSEGLIDKVVVLDDLFNDRN